MVFKAKLIRLYNSTMLGQIVPATCETYSNNQQQNSYAHAITDFKKNTSGHNNQQDNEN